MTAWDHSSFGACVPAPLTLEDVALTRGGRALMGGVSVALSPGGALLIAGANGIGKTSLLRAMAGLLPHGGRIAWGREKLASCAPACVHFIGHADAVRGELSVGETLLFWGVMLEGTVDPRVALEAVGLGALRDMRAGQLSAGQRRRLALARLVMAPRPLWLMDEPATALDRDGLLLLAGLVARHRAAGGIVVAATHAPLEWPGCAVLTLERAS